MKNLQHITKPVLCVIAGLLAISGTALAADDLAERYINGYLNDPYGGPSKSDPATYPYSDRATSRGAEGPVREDAMAADSDAMAMKADKMKHEMRRIETPVGELYNPPYPRIE